MNFGRVVRMAIRYKFTFAASICFRVDGRGALGGQYRRRLSRRRGDLQEPVDAAMDRREDPGSQATIAAENGRAGGLRQQLAAAETAATQAPRDELEREIANAEDGSHAAAVAAALQIAKPYIDDYLPGDPFQTLLLITGLLLLGTVMKDVFLVANNVLVARLAQRATFDLRKLFYRRTLRMDLATFSEDGTADLMSRFTNDMSQVAGGLDSLFGKLVREPLKMFACLALAAFLAGGCCC